MLYPTAGSRFYIADAPADNPGSLPASGWVEIGEVEALGMLGVEWGVASADIAGEEYGLGGYLVEHSSKIALRRPVMQIIMANDPADPGQILLWNASASVSHFPFRIVLPDGATTRAWTALVVSMSEVFDAANGVMRLQAELKPSSSIYRNGVA